MKHGIALAAALFAAAVIVACGEDPVEQIIDPQITLSADSVLVNVGASTSVSATVTNTTAQPQFISRDPSVAIVNGSGSISGVTAGSTYVVATLPNNANVRDSVRVRVQAPAAQLTLSKDSVVVTVGESATVTATVSNASAQPQFISRDESVATVNASGAISGVTAGWTYVVATLSNDANVRDSVRVRVRTQEAAKAELDSAFVTMLREHLEFATTNGQFSGAVLVERDGHTVFEGAYGLADRERGIPNTMSTQFRVGSMNKMLTAVATLQMVQAGTLSLDAPLGTYLPDYPNADVKSLVTLHQMLTHTGGTGDIFGPEFMAHRLELRTIDDYLELYGTRPLQFAPGSQHVYSNYGFMLLGAIVERMAGTSYYDHIAARVHAPAGMTATGSAPEDSLVPDRSVGYTWNLTPGSLVSNAPDLPYRGTPAGGGYSTVGDMARFAVALREHRLLDPTHTALLFQGKVSIPNTGGWQYAYGFVDRIVDGRRIVGHSGGDLGMNGDLAFEPNGGYVVVVLSNFDPPFAQQMSTFILNRLP